MIPYGKQIISQNDIEEVVEVLKSDFLTQGPQVELFENKIKSICNVKFASAVSSATAALHISCIALGIKKGDFGWNKFCQLFPRFMNCHGLQFGAFE